MRHKWLGQSFVEGACLHAAQVCAGSGTREVTDEQLCAALSEHLRINAAQVFAGFKRPAATKAAKPATIAHKACFRPMCLVGAADTEL